MKILDTLQIIIKELDEKVNSGYSGKKIFIYNFRKGGIGNMQSIDISGENERFYNGENREIKKES